MPGSPRCRDVNGDGREINAWNDRSNTKVRVQAALKPTLVSFSNEAVQTCCQLMTAFCGCANDRGPSARHPLRIIRIAWSRK
jgi:hypothetical protein